GRGIACVGDGDSSGWARDPYNRLIRIAQRSVIMMTMTHTTFVLTLFLAAGVAGAQTKISGTGKCGKADKQEMIEVGDRANHSIMIMKVTCTWTAPMEMAGLKSKSYTVTMMSDSSGEKSQDRGYVVVTMENGDKAFV